MFATFKMSPNFFDEKSLEKYMKMAYGYTMRRKEW